MMNILADEDIVDVVKLFGRFGDVDTCPGRDITNDRLTGVDVLLVRSVTNVDRQLLLHSDVRFVGSATIGIDHVDHQYLQSNNIQFAHAPGCNASAVVQYVLAVLCSSVCDWRDKTIGIIGCGNVGGQLLRCLQKLGVKCKVYDPVLNETQCPVLVDFANVMTADIICCHTPLTRSGSFPSYHMIDQAVLESLQGETVLINAGRGAVIDGCSLLDVSKKNRYLQVVLDVWEHEPAISLPLLSEALLGTPHIAGHSIEGKLRGTQMLLEAFCQWRGESSPDFSVGREAIPLHVDKNASLESIVLQVYNPLRDYKEMVAALTGSDIEVGQQFDMLRRCYPQRREFSHYSVVGVSEKGILEDLKVLGFRLKQLV
ncbi:MAG: erythronate-4-phosphate dehydrogenase [Gammaproteobacteria bacterium]|nr:MAG: erythronate-4-phosphate dehydrogenase [Gammaproteobacteria bacterium]RLA53376.1 MAG: erythronate-4-phosphate dehydrogenase [Gammaproteobacteria bacterium]